MKKISGLTPISGEIQGEDILVVNTAGGTRKITYAELCEAVRATLGVREVVESVNITEPGFLMDGKTVSDAFAQLNGNIEQLNNHHIPKNLGTSPLNDIKITGVYYQTTNINAVLERNYPIKQAGLLLVYYCTDDWVYQIYVPYTDTTIFKRVFYIFNPGWYPWVKFDGMNI